MSDQATDFETMVAHAEAAASELFVNCKLDLTAEGLEPTPGTSSAEDEWIVASIGFASEAVRGALLLSAARATIRSWAAFFEDAPLPVEDVLGELANMLLGQFKSRLMSEGLVVLMSTPTAMVGLCVSILPPREESISACLHFTGPGGRLDVRLDVNFEPDFELHAGAPATAAAAGDVMIF